MKQEKKTGRSRLAMSISALVIGLCLLLFSSCIQDVHTVVDLSIAAKPRTGYTVGSTLDLDGLELRVLYNDGAAETVAWADDASISVSPGNGMVLDTVGVQTVKATYADHSVVFAIRVSPIALVDFSVLQQPTDDSYVEGTSLDFSGLTVRAAYADGTDRQMVWGTDSWDDGIELSVDKEILDDTTVLEEPGSYTVRVAYENWEASFPIAITEASMIGLAIANGPTKVTGYYTGDRLNLEGLTVRLNYDNQTSQDVAWGDASWDLADIDVELDGKSVDSETVLADAGTLDLTVRCNGYFDTFSVRVQENVVKALAVVRWNDRQYKDEIVDMTSLQIEATFANGTKETVGAFDDRWNALGISMSDSAGTVMTKSSTWTQLGNQTVRFSCEEGTATYQVSVTDLSVTSVTIASNPTKTSYYAGDTLSLSGLQADVSYSDGSTKTLDWGTTIWNQEGLSVTMGGAAVSSSTKLDSAGSKTMTVSCDDKSASFTIVVEAVTVTSVTITHNPTKTSYYAGDTLSLSNLAARVTYSNGTSNTVGWNTSGWSQEGLSVTMGGSAVSSSTKLNSTGTKTVTVSCGGKSDTFTISVAAVKITGMTISRTPATSYYTSSTLNLNGLKVKYSYNNGDTEYKSWGTSGWNSAGLTVKSGSTTVNNNTKLFISDGTSRTLTVGDGTYSKTFSVTVKTHMSTSTRKVVGYFENWAQYRSTANSFSNVLKHTASDIDNSNVTDVIIAFGMVGYIQPSVNDPYSHAILNTGSTGYASGDYRIYPSEWNDVNSDGSGTWHDVVARKGGHLKRVLLAVGGWTFTNPGYNNATQNIFSNMVKSSSNRNEFINDAIRLCKAYGFDGIDIDWEYPGQQGAGGNGVTDMANFLTFLKAAYPRFKDEGLYLTYAAPAIAKGAGTYVNGGTYDSDYYDWLEDVSRYVDWINLMGYDLYVGTEAGGLYNQSQLYTTGSASMSMDQAVQAMLDAGIDGEKIVLGMPTYARAFGTSGTNSSYGGSGWATTAVKGYDWGLLSYADVMDMKSGGSFTKKNDSTTKTTYMYGTYGGNTFFVPYPSTWSLGEKCDYVKDYDLGGGMVWTIGLDDFDGGYPLLDTIYDSLK